MYEQKYTRLEGQIIVRFSIYAPCCSGVHADRPVCSAVVQGFDEYMNVVLDGAEEINTRKKTRKRLGRLLLKGDNVTLIQKA